MIEIKGDEGRIINVLEYKLEFLYKDEIGTEYRVAGNFKGASGKLTEAEEI